MSETKKDAAALTNILLMIAAMTLGWFAGGWQTACVLGLLFIGSLGAAAVLQAGIERLLRAWRASR